MAKQGLGRGLNALLGGAAAGAAKPAAIAGGQPGEAVLHLHHNRIDPSPLQPRKEFNEEDLLELRESIREQGIIQPLIVREVNGRYELIAGERRWRAAGELNLVTVPAIVRDATDQEVLEIALIENIQRENLNPMEEARAYQRLSQEFGLKQEEISRRVGKNRSTIANALRLLDLDPMIQSRLEVGELSVGHAKAILGVKDPALQRTLADEVASKALNVRSTEKLVATRLSKPRISTVPSLSPTQTLEIRTVEQQLRENFMTNVKIIHSEQKGRIEIEYFGVEQLNRILQVLGIEDQIPTA